MKTKQSFFVLSGGVPKSAPTAAMGFRAYWQAMDGTQCYSDAGTTPCVNNDPCYRLTESLGVVSNSYFEQATLDNRPTFKTGGANSKSYLSFDSTNDFMVSLAASNFFSAGAKTILIVGKIRAGWANGDQLLGDAASYFYCLSATGNLIKFTNYAGAYQTSTGTAFVDGAASVLLFKHDTGKLYDAVNNTTWSTGVTSGNTSVLTGLTRVGVTGSGYAPLDLYALAFANTVISDANLTLVINYFKAQLGI